MINVHLSEGFGNNIFQVLFAEYLSNITGAKIYVTGAQCEISKLYPSSEFLSNCAVITDRRKSRAQIDFNELVDLCVDQLEKNYAVYLKGNFEYWEIFTKISIDDTPLKIYRRRGAPTSSIKIHLRLNNRLVQLNHAVNWVDPVSLIKTVKERYPRNEIELITDFDFVSAEQDLMHLIDTLKKECKTGPNSGALLLPSSVSFSYAKLWLDTVKQHNVRVSSKKMVVYESATGGLSRDFVDDFFALQSAKRIILWGSTFSYLAYKFSDTGSAATVLSPWKLDKNGTGPFLDTDPSVDTLTYNDYLFKGQSNVDRLVLLVVRNIPYLFRHYLQAFLSKIKNAANT